MLAKIFKWTIGVSFQSLPDVFVFLKCHLRSSAYPNPAKPVVAKLKSRFIGEPKIFATKAQRHEGFYYSFLVSWSLCGEKKKNCHKMKKHTIKILTERPVSINGQAG
jgi:hypothetical protein